ncbi:MAG: helix-turn-helix transcriptional regulator [Pseudobutyrivibrio sp.]|nr:helix-turn-helix transcriptional regulator [Pseudobutyrivibrio sp.]
MKNYKTWDEIRTEIFTPEEIAESDIRVALMGELVAARKEQGLTQRGLEKISGVRQPVIARIENGEASPRLDTLIKLLAPLGKTLSIVPLNK